MFRLCCPGLGNLRVISEQANVWFRVCTGVIRHLERTGVPWTLRAASLRTNRCCPSFSYFPGGHLQCIRTLSSSQSYCSFARPLCNVLRVVLNIEAHAPYGSMTVPPKTFLGRRQGLLGSLHVILECPWLVNRQMRLSLMMAYEVSVPARACLAALLSPPGDVPSSSCTTASLVCSNAFKVRF